jgi:hypothetical protein
MLQPDLCCQTFCGKVLANIIRQYYSMFFKPQFSKPNFKECFMKLSRILIAVLACTSLLLAQEAAAPAPKAAKAKKEAGSACMGTVVSVDAIANTIIVKTKKGDDTISVESSAKIMSGKKEIALGDIKADSKVTIACKTVDGKKVASKITVSAAKAMKTTKKTSESTTSTTTTTTEPAAAPAAEPAAK